MPEYAYSGIYITSPKYEGGLSVWYLWFYQFNQFF